MPDTKVRSTKLTFKGEKKKKKRKREADDDGGRSGDDGDTDPQAWVRPDIDIQILGPTFILHPSEPHPTCVAYESTRSRVTLQSMPLDDSEGQTRILDLTPKEVSQVWVVTRVAGSATINLRTPEGKFLSSDAHGIVSSDREARGPQEEWTPIIIPDTGGLVAFQNIYSKYLGVDEVAGGSLALRADSENIGFAESFYVKVQHEYKKKAGEDERKKKEGVDTGKGKIDEAGTK
ncbi:hypothetical protein FRC02_005811 [Tulasnella sp. 418]|nr:hypothetical protein FRC02_005811 [Tulasnella sp. 418]